MSNNLDDGLILELEDGFALRTLARPEDIERLASFNVAIHGADIGPMVRSLLREFPGLEPEDQVFVESEAGEIVSSLCLIPWTWRCEDVLLRVGELGIVGTEEAFRGRGLVRAQVDYFMRRLGERGCVLSSIQGIPYFYRQFGYEYALPLEGGYRWEFRQMPDSVAHGLTIRRAVLDDIPALGVMYEEAMSGLCFSSVRSDEVWRYLLTRKDPADAMHHDTLVVEGSVTGDGSGALLGYMRIPHFHFGEELVIDEGYASGIDATVALLDHARGLALAREKPGVRLNLPATSHFVRLALAHGATPLGTYSWQIHIPDDAALMRTMGPVLAARLARSPFAGWTGVFRVSFYNRGLEISFGDGVLTGTAATRAPDEAELRLPHAAFVSLALGDRSLAELREQYPDVGADGMARLLTETLFPKRASFIHTTY